MKAKLIQQQAEKTYAVIFDDRHRPLIDLPRSISAVHI